MRVALVEDSVLLREGLVRLIAEAGFEVAASGGDANNLFDRVSQVGPDVVVLDVRLPPTFRDEGVRAALQLRETFPDLGILVLSQYVEGVYARELLADGGSGMGYLLKDRVVALEEFTEAVRRVHRKGTVLDPEVVATLLASNRDPLATLTPRERDVLEQMAQGGSNTRIADNLGISLGTVEKNISAVFSKLGLEDSPEHNRRVQAVLAFVGAQ
ncbi:response regulator transcription factor [Actinomycetaceae bacterium MB13-C1-2]|nr:response regulator transcription factor [Actinomycetaceae bacterium MB13-C1-2]